MKISLLITTFNRPNYLKDCLWSLERADLSRIDEIWIYDDCSTIEETKDLIRDFCHKNEKANFMFSIINRGIKDALLYSYELLFLPLDKFNRFGNDIVINLDSDAIVRPDFVERLLENIHKTGGGILTGFHSTTTNANGTERHKIKYDFDDILFKESVGGINFCIDKHAYEKFVKPALNSPGNFDHNSCLNAGGAWCLKESVIQHIGFDSSMNHNEAPDVADDFYYWDLPTVTLIGVDSQKERLQRSIDICTKWIKFGEVKLLHEPINSKEGYSKFCIEELYKHVKTEHMLICQHDGYVNNWQAWDNDWLQYDYIGAPWHYNDGMAVGNGGFSLRSRRLMEIVATDKNIQIQHPEDHHICRTYRPYLEKTYGIKFAPIEVAEKFSFEGYLQPAKTLKEQFGVHGSNPRKIAAQPIKTQRYIVNQAAGLGDILFLVPLVRALMQEGNSVLWPIADHYFNIAKHFPDIKMVKKSDYHFLPYETKGIVETQFGRMLPYRFASEILGHGFRTMMRDKYDLYGHSHLMWRGLTYSRFRDKENELKQLVGAIGDYVLINRDFGEPSRGMKSTINYSGENKVIEMRIIPGYSLIDWLGVIESAIECHVANSSIMYLLELMDIKTPVNVYKRLIFAEKAFEHTDYLWTNKSFIFEK